MVNWSWLCSFCDANTNRKSVLCDGRGDPARKNFFWISIVKMIKTIFNHLSIKDNSAGKLQVTKLIFIIQFFHSRCAGDHPGLTNGSSCLWLRNIYLPVFPFIFENKKDRETPHVSDNHRKMKTFLFSSFSSSGGFWWTSWPREEGREWRTTSRGSLPTFTLINTFQSLF